MLSRRTTLSLEETVMAKKPSNASKRGEGSDAPQAAGPSPATKGSDRDAAIDALLELAVDRDWNEIELGDIADRAGLKLSQLRVLFPSKGAILAGFSRRIDEVVLDGIDEGMADEPARERLFDTLMRRVDALGPYRLAIASLARSFGRDPLALAAWNRVVVNSMQWMLAAADIGSDGPMGAIRAQGLAIAWSRIIRVWLEDEDEGLARTMTEIDRQLRSGERWMERADDLWRVTSPFRRIAERSMRRRSRLRDRVRERFEDLASGRGRRGRGRNDDEAEAM
jgi:AcrR family transcriptional regulator